MIKSLIDEETKTVRDVLIVVVVELLDNEDLAFLYNMLIRVPRNIHGKQILNKDCQGLEAISRTFPLARCFPRPCLSFLLRKRWTADEFIMASHTTFWNPSM
jgi:hypothetical protein